MTAESQTTSPRATVRCGFCLTWNRIDMSRAGDRPQCGECGKPILLDRPMKISQDDFDRTIAESEVPVLVDFYADWCGPCRMVAPKLDALAQQTVGRLLVVKLDTDRAPDVAARHEIRSIPTLILFRDGVENDRIIGFDPDALVRVAERV